MFSKLLSPIHKAMRQASLYMEANMEGVTVKPNEAHLLSFVASHAPATVTELVRVFGQKPSTMTSMLDRLERDGLLIRVRRPEDRRSFAVSLTTAGGREATRIRTAIQRFEAKVRRHVGTGDMEGFRRVMAAIHDVSGVHVRKERA